MSAQPINITSPVGRVVSGNLYKGNSTDFDGNPLVVKTGPNVGQLRTQFFFAIAVPKAAGETHWSQTAWGAKIWALGHQAFPQGAQRPDFAWKIEDGDSTIPNKRNKLPRDNEGWPGNWIIKFSGGFAPKVYRWENGAAIQEQTSDYVKPGYFVEVNFNVAGNDNQNNPGVYLNHSMVMFRGYGAEISFGPNVEYAGFGQAPLPAGASVVPLASSQPLPVPAASVTVPTAPVVQTTVTPVAPVSASPSSPIPVLPNPGFLQMPPPPPTAPAAPVGPIMTPAANGVTYQAYKTAGWSDDQLVTAGLMTR